VGGPTVVRLGPRQQNGVVTVSSPAKLACMGEHNISGVRKPKNLARVSAAVLPGVGLVAVLVGCFVAWSNANANIGWFAYAPLSNQLFSGSGT
jgi:hypothetical protein